MKKYIKEIVILFLQLFMFYIFPLFAGPTDAMGMVFLIWLSTLILGLFIMIFSSKKIKFLYPFVISILFVPSVFIYYNESALIHSLWYFFSSIVGMFFGKILTIIFLKRNFKN